MSEATAGTGYATVGSAQLHYERRGAGALVDTAPGAADVSRTLDAANVSVTFKGDPAGATSPPYRAARWLAERRGSEMSALPGGRMPYASAPVQTAAAIRAAAS